MHTTINTKCFGELCRVYKGIATGCCEKLLSWCDWTVPYIMPFISLVPEWDSGLRHLLMIWARTNSWGQIPNNISASCRSECGKNSLQTQYTVALLRSSAFTFRCLRMSHFNFFHLSLSLSLSLQSPSQRLWKSLSQQIAQILSQLQSLALFCFHVSSWRSAFTSFVRLIGMAEQVPEMRMTWGISHTVGFTATHSHPRNKWRTDTSMRSVCRCMRRSCSFSV